MSCKFAKKGENCTNCYLSKMHDLKYPCEDLFRMRESMVKMYSMTKDTIGKRGRKELMHELSKYGFKFDKHKNIIK